MLNPHTFSGEPKKDVVFTIDHVFFFLPLIESVYGAENHT